MFVPSHDALGPANGSLNVFSRSLKECSDVTHNGVRYASVREQGAAPVHPRSRGNCCNVRVDSRLQNAARSDTE